MPKTYVEYTVTNPEYRTVAELIDNDPIFGKYVNRLTEFLDYAIVDGLPTNRDRVRSLYNTSGDLAITDDNALPLKLGTPLYIAKSEIETLSDALLLSLPIADDGEDGEDGSGFSSFVSQTFLDLTNNPQYKSVTQNEKAGNYTDFFPQITVLLYSRVLGKVINLSRFVISCSTNSNSMNSTFQLSLPPIIGKFSDDQWGIDEGALTNLEGGSFLAYSTLQRDSIDKEQTYFFEKVISQSDLVFIQYETLELEKTQRAKDNSRFFLGIEDLNTGDPENPKVYDLMGSVDSIGLSINPSSGVVDIQVSGRDFTKFLIDDGSYFFYEELVGNLIPDLPKNEKIRGRIYGSIPSLNALGYRDINTQLNIILRLFYTTGYYDDEIFSAWDNKNESITISQDFKDFERVSRQKELESRDLIGSAREDFDLTSTNSADERTEVRSIFNELKQRIEDDTLKSNGLLTNEAFDSLSGRLFDESKLNGQDPTQINSVSLAIDSVQAYVEYIENNKPESRIDDPSPREGVWSIFDIEVDPSIANIKVADNKLNEANGSILNSIKSLVEEPYMEVFTDTYSDRFKLIARRQPFDEVYYNDLFDKTVKDTGLNVIDADDVISSNLNFNEENIFTWFYYKPNGFTYGDVGSATFAYIQAIMLNEYIDIWGSKPYFKETNYSIYESGGDTDSKVTPNLKQAIFDLRYTVEINAYNPFVRQGTITIIGDRTFKKKTALYYKPTNEVFHIDAVQNNYVNSSGVDRTTTLQVSRGMVRDYMKTDKVKDENGDLYRDPDSISYFNLVNTNIKDSDLRRVSQSDFATKITQNWGVNKNVLDFFLARKQFASSLIASNQNNV